MSVDGEWSAITLGASGKDLKYSVQYHGDKKGWLTDWLAWKIGDVYVVCASSANKRADCSMAGSTHTPSGSGVCVTFTIEDPKDVTSISIAVVTFWIDPDLYHAWAFDYRYGPTVVLCPFSYASFKPENELPLIEIEQPC